MFEIKRVYSQKTHAGQCPKQEAEMMMKDRYWGNPYAASVLPNLSNTFHILRSSNGYIERKMMASR
jgi:hypothetical protein